MRLPVELIFAQVNAVNVKDSTTSEVSQVKFKTLNVPGCPEFKKRREDGLTITLLRGSTSKGGFCEKRWCW